MTRTWTRLTALAAAITCVALAGCGDDLTSGDPIGNPMTRFAEQDPNPDFIRL